MRRGSSLYSMMLRLLGASRLGVGGDVLSDSALSKKEGEIPDSDCH